MSNHLPNITNTPPGGWKFKVEATNQEFTSTSLDGLMQKLLAHYDVNSLDIPPNLAKQIEESICNRAPDYCTGNEASHPSFVPGAIHTAGAILQGSRTLLTWWLKGAKRVTQEEANARAAICSTCPENTKPTDCTVCNLNSFLKISEKISGGKSTPSDSKLESCRICSCVLKGKVWIPKEDLTDKMTDAQKEALPSHCWLK